MVALIEETRRLELLQQEAEEAEDVDTDTDSVVDGGANGHEEDEEENDDKDEIPPVVEVLQVMDGDKATVDQKVELSSSEAAITDSVEQKRDSVNKANESQLLENETETIPVFTAKNNAPVDSTNSNFMAEMMTMFDGIVSSTSPTSDSGLGVDDANHTAKHTAGSDTESDIEEGIVKRIQRTTIVTSDLTVSRV